MKAKFSVAYEVVTHADCDDCEDQSGGWIGESMPLRDAVKELHGTRTNMVDGVECIEPDSRPCDRPRSIRVCNGMEFETGAYESRTLFIPESVTRSTARRIARIVGVKL